MARPSKEEIAEWEARMQEPEESDDEDFEVVLFNEQGNPVGTMPYRKAKPYFRKHGIELDDELPTTDPTATQEPATPAKTAKRPTTTSRYFGNTPQNPDLEAAPGAVIPTGR